jgi:predicted dehydrogenase
MDLKGIHAYRHMEDFLADPAVELVDVCLPPALHADVSIKALQAGKHIFCEKPIALTTRDARRMVNVAQREDRLLMIGHVLPFAPEYAYVMKIVRSGKYGRMLGGNFKRVVADPFWIDNYFDADVIGGPMLDLHIHDAHFIRLLCGMPKAVFTSGRMRGAVPEYFTSQFFFDERARLAVTATSGTIDQQGRAFTQAFEIHLQKATLLFDFAVIRDKPVLQTPLTVLDAEGKVHRPKLGAGDPVDAFRAELKDVVKAVRTHTVSSILDGQLACDALALCHKQTQSLKRGRIVRI